jgi:DNA invertase Pin-like site-specific DNA recombinase
MTKRACIYCRVSVDRDLDKATIERQEAECRALATARGFEVAEVFIDRNLSAFKRGVVRKDYEAMKARVAEGEFDAVFAYRLDRLSRSLSEALKLIELLDDHKTGLVMVSGNIDTTGPMGKAFFQISAIFAELEAATTSERLKGYNQTAAAQGEMPTGGRRCYGYVGKDDDKKGLKKGQIIPEEAAALHMARSAIMSGVPIRETARRLNESGSRTTMGSEWSPRSLVKCLKSPRLRGKRTHLGQITEIDGNWEAIFTEDEQLALIAKIIASAETYRSSGQRVGNKHLLTGLAICGLCGGRMGYNRSKKGDVRHPRYQCIRAPGSKGCGRLSVDEAKLDTYVIASVREFGGHFVTQAEARRRELVDQMAQDEIDLATNEQTLADLTRDRYAPDSPLTDDVYAELRAPLIERIDTLKDRLSRPRAELEKLPEPSWIRTGLSKLPEGVDGREYLRGFLKHVEILPARKRGVRFSGDRVRLHWLSGDVTTDADLLALASEDAIWAS